MIELAPTRTWRLRDFEQGLSEPEESLRDRAAAAVGVGVDDLRGFRIARRALDARRRRGRLCFICHVDLVLDVHCRTAALAVLERSGRVAAAPVPGRLVLEGVAVERRSRRAVVVGSGPAGTFAALVLALNGLRPILIERGAQLEKRTRSLVRFRRGGSLDPENNLLFGEGGAGTYSDGKLYTRVEDALEVPLLEELVACGAPPEILFDSRAHIGTDRLHRLLPRLRARLEQAGVAFSWDTRLEGLITDEGPTRTLRAVRTSRGELPCDVLVLAIGHSARDTWTRLAAEGVPFLAKPFQFGVRVEHPQALVTRGRYGDGPEAALLGPASYNLVCRGGVDGPEAHSFCMCPGGRVVASVSEEGMLCTNGMSNSTHSSRWANAAVVTTLVPNDYAPHGAGPFAGVAFQRHYEREFFDAGGANYAAPAQRVPDFLAGRRSAGELLTSYTFGVVPGRIDALLPERVRDALRRALGRFDRQIPGFAGQEGILVGVESRSSGPVRIPRDRDTFVAEGWCNLYPAGEGAGYAGGIMSAALDGAHCAQAWLRSES